MNVGGVGAMGIAGVGMAGGALSAGSMGGLNGPLGDFHVAGLNGLAGTRMDQLQQLLGDFSSAEILIALMLSAGSKRGCRQCDDDGMAMLLGLSLASSLGQTMPQFIGPPPEIASAATGQMINLTA